jgi:hypothetical protein
MKNLIFCLIIFCTSCNIKEQEKINVKTYFDLEEYFNQEILRLSKLNPTINKTVIVNGQAEYKKIKIYNWKQELSSFINSDINKASWRGSFRTIVSKNLITYTTNNPKIPVKKLEIIYKSNKVFAIKVFVKNVNSLYTSQDSLTYFQDSLYQIKKIQLIRLMDKKEYQVIGKF